MEFRIDGAFGAQINQVVTHPTLPLVMTAHEDNYIRIFDINSGEFNDKGMIYIDVMCVILNFCKTLQEHALIQYWHMKTK